MPATTPNRKYPYPLGPDPIDVAGDLQKLAEALDVDSRQIVKPDTSAAYSPILSDENKLITLSNAAPITVYLPADATTPFAIGAQVDFLWLGAGQPTFAPAAGGFAYGTPSLALRDQYSAASAKKVAADTWVVIGDMA